MVAKIQELGKDPSIDGIFISLMGAFLEDAVRAAAREKLIVTINSGSDVSQSLDPGTGKLIGHVGMDEFAAGRAAGCLALRCGAERVSKLRLERGMPRATPSPQHSLQLALCTKSEEGGAAGAPASSAELALLNFGVPFLKSGSRASSAGGAHKC